DPWRFTFYTLLGGTAWNTFLLRVGIELRERWYLVERYTHQIDYAVLAALVLAGAWWAYRRLRTLRAGGTETGESAARAAASGPRQRDAALALVLSAPVP